MIALVLPLVFLLGTNVIFLNFSLSRFLRVLALWARLVFLVVHLLPVSAEQNTTALVFEKFLDDLFRCAITKFVKEMSSFLILIISASQIGCPIVDLFEVRIE